MFAARPMFKAAKGVKRPATGTKTSRFTFHPSEDRVSVFWTANCETNGEMISVEYPT